VFGARGATTFLQKLTSAAAILYMVTTISLAWYSSDAISTRSVLDEEFLQNFQSEEAVPPPAPNPGTTSPDVSAPEEAPPAMDEQSVPEEAPQPPEGASLGSAPMPPTGDVPEGNPE